MSSDSVTVKKRVGYSAIPNAAMSDRNLSIEARGLLALLLTMKEGWVFRPSHLMEECGVGRDRFYRMLAELKDRGYVSMEREKDEKGMFSRTSWQVVSNPHPEYPDTGNPESGESDHIRKTNPKKNNNKTPNPLKGADLFSETEEPKGSGSRVDQENDRFDEFWKVYPKKEGKPSARKAWAKAVKRADPDEIIAGAKAYADWLSSAAPGEFRPHTKHPQGWLNDDRWEAFTGQVEAYREEDLSPNQRNALREGRIPPSLQNPDGSPNAKARYWLTAYGYGEAAE